MTLPCTVLSRWSGGGRGFQRLEEEAAANGEARQHARHEETLGLGGGLWERHVELQPASSPTLHSYQQLESVLRPHGSDPFWDA